MHFNHDNALSDQFAKNENESIVLICSSEQKLYKL